MKTPLIDNLQYANWSPEIFAQMRAGGVDAVHVTIAYHESFREMVLNLERWNRWFETHPDLIFKGTTADDVRRAQETGRTAIFFGFQNPSPIEDDIGLVEICHQLGIRFMQLTYNNQSLLATGCYEDEDTGLTRMGKQVVAEMNRVGMVVDMSHSAERSTLEAIDHSTRPIAITHANPHWWHPALRNKSDAVLQGADRARRHAGLFGLSASPRRTASACTLDSFCEMIAEAADRYGAQNLGHRHRSVPGSARQHRGMDARRALVQGDRLWRRLAPATPGFPPMPDWFHDNRDFGNIRDGSGRRRVSQRQRLTASWAATGCGSTTKAFGPA